MKEELVLLIFKQIDDIRGYSNNKIVERTKQINLGFDSLFREFIVRN